MGTFYQKSFQSGLNQLQVDMQVADTGYQWLINGRNRFGPIQPIASPLELDNAPVGLKQGLIAVGNILVLFCAGKAYYRNYEDSNDWIQIPNFLMSVDAPQVWSQAVPASTFNFVRLANANVQAELTITNDFKVAGTPAGIIVQDGITQPWLIEYDSTNQIFLARLTKTFDQWDNAGVDANSREYVPIGKQMMFMNQILFIVAPDNKSCYRSITGRPLDFMINVDINGNKAPSEVIGGASSMSFAFDFDDITCIQTIDIPDSFVYGTRHNTRIVTADYTNTLFDEPRFNESARVKSGLVNQYSFTDKLGDFVLIDFDGIKSFNAVQQLKFKGSNDVFSLALTKLLHHPITKKPIKQSNGILTKFENYIIANLDTAFGNLFCVYDTLLQQWTALDIIKSNHVKQFAVTESTLQDKLFCITSTDKVFQMYADANVVESPLVRTRGMIPQETDTEHKSAYLNLLFKGGTYDGIVMIREFVDDQENTSVLENNKPLDLQVAGINYPVIPPVIPSNKPRNQTITFPVSDGLTGKSISYIIYWNNDAQLLEYQLDTSDQKSNISVHEKEQLLA